MTRNCLYFVGPFGGSWVDNVSLLRRYADQFDGRVVVCVAQGRGASPLADVVRAFRGMRVDGWLVVENDPLLRETPHLLRMLDSVKDASGITWFGHTKGVSNVQKTSLEWRDSLYELSLSKPASVDEALQRFPVAGPFRRKWNDWLVSKTRPNYTGEVSTSTWHFSGTFFWFRNEDLFQRKWDRIEMHRWGAEAYPSTHFSWDESACLGVDNCQDLYDIRYWKIVRTEIDKWRRA